MLREDLRRRLLEDRGISVAECCDWCGRLLGAVRFTRRGEPGVWCSRECRDGKEAHEPGTCKHCHAVLPKGKRRGSSYCDDACKQAALRSRHISDRKLSVTKPSIYAGFCSISDPRSYPHTRKPENVLIADKFAAEAQR